MLRLIVWVGLAMACAFNAVAEDAPQDAAALIKQLGSDKFEERDAAKKKLIELGPRAVEALNEAGKSGDPEIKTKAGEILAAIKDNLDPLTKPARETYEAALISFQRGLKDVESVYTWSLRWAEAAPGTPAEYLAALKAHLARMQTLEAAAVKMEGAGQCTKMDATAAKYFLKQAELLVKQAQLEGQKP